MSNQLFTKSQFHQLIVNGELPYKDRAPVVKLDIKGSDSQWLLTELFYKHNMAYGLADFGNGYLKVGLINLSKIKGLQSADQVLEPDQNFAGRYNLSVYVRAAKNAGRITIDENDLRKAEQEILAERK